MDYQELIERLRGYTYWLGKDEPCSRDIHPPICDEAADAISALLEASTTLDGTYVSAEWFNQINGELQAYKKTGLEPKEIVEVQEAMEPIPFGRFHDIMEAERGGRLVVLPCKVTDTVYIVETVFENGKQRSRNKPSGERVVSAQIDHVTIGGTTGKPVFDLCSETGGWHYALEPGEFFLTREEAEAELKKGDHT